MICASAARLPSIAGGVTQEQRVLRRARVRKVATGRGLQPERRVFGHYGKQVVNLLSGLAEFLKSPVGEPTNALLLRKIWRKYTF
jgi:hypothetical protein